jgi:hypothetical protein
MRELTTVARGRRLLSSYTDGESTRTSLPTTIIYHDEGNRFHPSIYSGHTGS